MSPKVIEYPFCHSKLSSKLQWQYPVTLIPSSMHFFTPRRARRTETEQGEDLSQGLMSAYLQTNGGEPANRHACAGIFITAKKCYAIWCFCIEKPKDVCYNGERPKQNAEQLYEQKYSQIQNSRYRKDVFVHGASMGGISSTNLVLEKIKP